MAKEDREKLKKQLRIIEDMIEHRACDDSVMLAISKSIVGLLRMGGGISMEQVSRRYGVSSRTIRRWIESRGFPSGKHAGRKDLSFYIDEIAEWEVKNSSAVDVAVKEEQDLGVKSHVHN